jgi:hypothetical protein
MSVSFAKMNVKTNNSKEKIEFNNTEIEVVQYLPSSDKYDLVMIALQKAEENGIYNPLKLNIYFHLNLIYMYTNIAFTAKQREDEFELYDKICSSGLLDAVIKVIPEDEYNELVSDVERTEELLIKKNQSVTSLLQSFVEDLPRNAEAAAKIVDNFDKTKYKEVLDLAKAAGAVR